MPVAGIENVPAACVDLCASIAARPPMAFMCRSMIDRADGRSACSAVFSFAAAACFGAAGLCFGGAGACFGAEG